MQVLLRWPGLSWRLGTTAVYAQFMAYSEDPFGLESFVFRAFARRLRRSRQQLKVLFFLAREGVSVCFLVGGLEHEWIIFPFSWEFHHPFDFHSIIFQRGRVETTNQFQSIVKWCEMVVWAVLRATFYKRVSTVDQVKPPIRHSPQGELH